MQKDWQEFEDNILRIFYPLGNWTACAELLERSKPSIKNRAYKLGLHINENVRSELAKNFQGHKHSEETRILMSQKHKGVPKTAEHKEKMSARMSGNRHPNWQGGRSLLPYTDDFNPRLKKEVLKRDNVTCQKCGAIRPKRLVVHHIDWNKSNSILDNLITICITCHNKHHHSKNTNVEAEKAYFESIIAAGGFNR